MKFTAPSAIRVKLTRADCDDRAGTLLPHLALGLVLARRYPAAIVYAFTNTITIDGQTYAHLWRERRVDLNSDTPLGVELGVVWLIKLEEKMHEQSRRN